MLLLNIEEIFKLKQVANSVLLNILEGFIDHVESLFGNFIQ